MWRTDGEIDITDRGWEEDELNERVSCAKNESGNGREIALLNEQIHDCIVKCEVNRRYPAFLG
jgi:uncharacterized protein YheU (UPF0270 family)